MASIKDKALKMIGEKTYTLGGEPALPTESAIEVVDFIFRELNGCEELLADYKERFLKYLMETAQVKEDIAMAELEAHLESFGLYEVDLENPEYDVDEILDAWAQSV